MKCKLFTFEHLDYEDCFIAALQDTKMSDLKKFTKDIPGKLVYSKDFECTENTGFGEADAKTVISGIKKQGYYIFRSKKVTYEYFYFVQCERCGKIIGADHRHYEIDPEENKQTDSMCIPCFKKYFPKAFEKYQKKEGK